MRWGYSTASQIYVALKRFQDAMPIHLRSLMVLGSCLFFRASVKRWLWREKGWRVGVRVWGGGGSWPVQHIWNIWGLEVCSNAERHSETHKETFSPSFLFSPFFFSFFQRPVALYLGQYSEEPQTIFFFMRHLVWGLKLGVGYLTFVFYSVCERVRSQSGSFKQVTNPVSVKMLLCRVGQKASSSPSLPQLITGGLDLIEVFFFFSFFLNQFLFPRSAACLPPTLLRVSSREPQVIWTHVGINNSSPFHHVRSRSAQSQTS